MRSVLETWLCFALLLGIVCARTADGMALRDQLEPQGGSRPGCRESEPSNSVKAAPHAHPARFAGAADGACAQQQQQQQQALASVESLFTRRRAWSDHSELLSAVRVGAPVTAAHWVAPAGGVRRRARWLALGDAHGGLHLLKPDGGLLAQYDTGALTLAPGSRCAARRRGRLAGARQAALGGDCDGRRPAGSPSAVMALASFGGGANRTVLVTGHASGELRLHVVSHEPPVRCARPVLARPRRTLLGAMGGRVCLLPACVPHPESSPTPQGVTGRGSLRAAHPGGRAAWGAPPAERRGCRRWHHGVARLAARPAQRGSIGVTA